MNGKLNKYSSRITQPPSQGASQAMLHATGLTRADLDKAQVGISAVWYEGNSCNMHLNGLAATAKRGVVEVGGHEVAFGPNGPRLRVELESSPAVGAPAPAPSEPPSGVFTSAGPGTPPAMPAAAPAPPEGMQNPSQDYRYPQYPGNAPRQQHRSGAGWSWQ